MPGPAAGESARADEPARVQMRDAIVPLSLLVALGLALRLIIAYVLLPGSGFGVDLGSFNGWAVELARNGPVGLYDRPIFIDYTPGYLYVLWALGLLSQALGGVGAAPGELLKLPAILADIGLALAIFSLAAELGASRRRALIAAAAFLLVPVTWFDSAVWGQVDSVGTLVLVLAVRELLHGRSERATVLATLAAITKPQFGILIPLAAVVIVRRHLVERPDDGSRLGGGPIRIVTTLIAGLATAILVCAPFGLSIVPLPFLGIGPEHSLVGRILSTAGGYPYLTVNAYNPWALVSMGGSGLALGGTWICDAQVAGTCSTWFSVAGVPGVLVGSVLIGAAIVGLMTYLWRHHDDKRAIVLALAVMAIVFFVLPTRVHERYLYPFFVFGAILLALEPRWVWAYVLLAVANSANLYGILTLPFYDNPGLTPMLDAFGGAGSAIGGAIRSSTGVTLAVVAHVVGLLLAVVFLARPAPRDADAVPVAAGGAWPDGGPPDRGSTGARPPDAVPVADGGPPGAHPQVAVVDQAASTLAPASGLSALPMSAARAFMTAVVEDGGSASPGPGQEGPGGAEQPDTLRHEGGGRFDRLDVWILLVLVVASLCLRTYRLGEPERMHFDEVYHARTAAEFLQDWRYGEPHDIYEWTHPHLAKYAIAGGLVLFGDDQVVATSTLDTPAVDAAIEPRWEAAAQADPGAPTSGGDRLYVATGSTLDVYDLRTRERLASFGVPGATSVAVDATAHVVYVGTQRGEILSLDSAVPADALRGATLADLETLGPVPFTDVGGATATPIEHLWVVGDGADVVAGTPGDGLAIFDLTGAELARVTLPGRADVVDAGSMDALVATPADVADPAAVAAELAGILGGDAASYRDLLMRDAPNVTITSDIAAFRDALDAAIADGRLPGVRVAPVPVVAVAGTAGVTFLEPSTGHETASVPLDAPATSLVPVDGLDKPVLYVATGSALAVVSEPQADTPPAVSQTVWMPGPLSRVTVDPASQLVHALGLTPGGTASTIYVVEPRGNSVFADAVLPFAPAAWAMDATAAYPGDRQQILTFAADGSSAAVDVGEHAFAWRLPGVLAGVLMAALLYILARILFRRRSVAVFAGLFMLVDGMLFAQSRIAMNDAYVGLFIVAAVTLFAAFWTGAWRWRGAFWAGMPIVGLLLGLALASKWVALYAIGGIGILILLRSASGRTATVLALATIAGVLGYMGIVTGPDATTGGNVPFLLLMIALTLAASAITVLHPVAWSVEEVRLVVLGPTGLGALIGLVGIPLGLGSSAQLVALALMALGGIAGLALWLGGRLGMGPLAPLPAPDDPAALLPPADPPPDGWLRPGWRAGIPVAWALVCLIAIPVAVYVVSYLPWAALGNQIVPGWPPGNTGQTLLDLTRSMYDYHDKLRATHAAASPWWAWPADLKPVWFYEGNFAGSAAGSIYDGGNILTWWLSIPAMAFAAWQGFRRRSLALGLVVIMFAAMWLPWARIDRATFQYHYYTALPFALLALAYFVAEIWHGPSRRTWLLARVATIVAVVGPIGLWLVRVPLCAVVGVERANPGSQACSGAASIPISLSAQLVAALAILLVGGGLVAWLVWDIDRAGLDGSGGPATRRRAVLAGTVAVAALAGLALAMQVLPSTPLVEVPSVPGEAIAVVLLLALAPVAHVIWHATSPRRFAVGLVLGAAGVFAFLYPNLSGLPIPASIPHNFYQALVPTWMYPFQFPVNTDPPVEVSLASPWALILYVAILLAACFIGYSAWIWRLTLAERAAEGHATEDPGAPRVARGAGDPIDGPPGGDGA